MANVTISDDRWERGLSASPNRARHNDQVTLTVTLDHPALNFLTEDQRIEIYERFTYTYTSTNAQIQSAIRPGANERLVTTFSFPSLPEGEYPIDVTVSLDKGFVLHGVDVTLPPAGLKASTIVASITRQQTEAMVTLQRTLARPLDDMAMGPAIRNRTAAVGFDRYKKFIDCLFCEPGIPTDPFTLVRQRIVGYLDRCSDTKDNNRQLSIYGPYAYGVLKLATQAFLTLESGVVIRDNSLGKPRIFDLEKERIRFNDFSLTLEGLNSRLGEYLQSGDQVGVLPYLNRILGNLLALDRENVEEVLPYCDGVLQYRLHSPSLIELIWSYWHEEGMLIQTINAIAQRFQNRRASQNDPLGELEFDPLRPLNNLLWGFIQDEHNRLTVPRRAYEYQHHYGLTLIGKGVPSLTPADSRSKFIEAFHNLLAGAARFFKEDSDTTVIADGFPLLNALKEVHLLLAEGAHNQFGDLTWTARAEMLMVQWLLARQEMREFLRGRYMVPYQESWMGAVDSMKKLQGWTDTTVTHFHELAVTGERILLSIRYGDWVDIENIDEQARVWARSWKPEIQRYIHGYRTVTGVDLSTEVTDSGDVAVRYFQPSTLLRRRLAEQISSVALPVQQRNRLIASRVSGLRERPTPRRTALPGYTKQG